MSLKFQTIKLFFCVVLLTACAETSLTHPSFIRDGDQAAVNDGLKKLAINSKGSCNAAIDPQKAQYVIGYGSLMQAESRKRTAPKAGEAYPVRLEGYRRGWFAKGTGVGFDTTYLGVVPEENARLNAVIFQLTADDIPAMDQRESFYCRLPVPSESYKVLKSATPLLPGQVWIYINRPESIAAATTQYPLVQSYVDIFVSGCLEQETNFGLTDFAKECLQTTTNWSTAWANDRLYPRRAFIYQPKAIQIDKLLQYYLPDYFQAIYLE